MAVSFTSNGKSQLSESAPSPHSGDSTSISKTLLLKGSRFDVIGMDLPGRDGMSHRREFIDHPGAVVMLPLLDADTVVLIENHRAAVGETLLELPAGTRDRSSDDTREPVLETAARELVEETGYTAESFEIWCEFYSAPGLGNESMHLVIARGLTAGPQQLEATEQITNRILRRDEIADLIRTKQIRDAKTLIGLQTFLFQLDTEAPP